MPRQRGEFDSKFFRLLLWRLNHCKEFAFAPTAAAICSRLCSPINPSCTATNRSRLHPDGSSLSCFCSVPPCWSRSSFCRGPAIHSLYLPAPWTQHFFQLSYPLLQGILLLGNCFRARRTGNGQNVDGRRGVRGYIKLADKICNLRDITRESPVNWPLQRKLDYLDWAEKVVAGCRGLQSKPGAAFRCCAKGETRYVQCGMNLLIFNAQGRARSTSR